MKCYDCNEKAIYCKCKITNLKKQDSITDFYSKMYKDIAYTDLKHSLQPESELQRKAEHDFTNIIKHVTTECADKIKVLEIGPGQGHLAEILISNGFDYSAMDITDEYLQNLSGKKYLANVETLEMLEFKFDLIILCDVMEHVLNEGDAILRVFLNLKCGGAVYVRSPLNEPLINYATLFGAPFRFVHLRTYSRKSICDLLASAGGHKIKTGTQARQKISFARRRWFGVNRHFKLVRHAAINDYGKFLSRIELENFFHKILDKLEYQLGILADKTSNSIIRTVHKFLFFRNTEVWALGYKICECRGHCD